MSDESFGDWEADDSLDTEPLDGEQVARRVHEDRAYLSELAGDELAAFDALSDDEEGLAVALGDRLVEMLTRDPNSAPWEFHEAVAFFSGEPEWEALSPGAREVAVGLIDDILDWASRQGALS
jgi:hypothetical protein